MMKPFSRPKDEAASDAAGRLAQYAPASEQARRLKHGLESYLNKHLLARQKVAIRSIEALRKRLIASDDEIETLVFRGGYGSPDGHFAPGKDTLGAVTRRAAKAPKWGRFLLTMSWALRAQRVLEMGSCVGISAGYLGHGIAPHGGRLWTLEGAPGLAAQATRSLATLDLADVVSVRTGLFSDTLKLVAEEAAPLDLVFVDGHHEGAATLAYVADLQDHLTVDATIVFDDIRWTEDMLEAWTKLRRAPNVALSVDLGDIGVVQLGAPPTEATHLDLDLKW